MRRKATRKTTIRILELTLHICNGKSTPKSILTTLKRSYPSEYTYLQEKVCRKCPSCGRFQPLIDYKDIFTVVEELDGFRLVVPTTYSHPRDKSYGKFMLCRLDGCPAKKLNANSTTFVSLAYGISELDAIGIIHSRSNTPFYAINHISNEEYCKFQGRANMDPEIVKHAQESQQKSYQTNKTQFIQIHGIDGWKKKNKNRNVYDVEKLKQKFGNDWENELNKRKRNTAGVKFTDINTTDFDGLRKFAIAQYGCDGAEYDYLYSMCTKHIETTKERYLTVVGLSMFLHRTEQYCKSPSPKLLVRGMKKFILLKLLFGVQSLHELFDVDHRVRAKTNHNVKMWAYASSMDGHFFRSAAELELYLGLIDIGIDVVSTNRKYPGTKRKFYDFEILYRGETYYIELCPFNNKIKNESYTDNVLKKSADYDSILVFNQKAFLAALKNNVDIHTEDFYTC